MPSETFGRNVRYAGFEAQVLSGVVVELIKGDKDLRRLAKALGEADRLRVVLLGLVPVADVRSSKSAAVNARRVLWIGNPGGTRAVHHSVRPGIDIDGEAGARDITSIGLDAPVLALFQIQVPEEADDLWGCVVRGRELNRLRVLQLGLGPLARLLGVECTGLDQRDIRDVLEDLGDFQPVEASRVQLRV